MRRAGGDPGRNRTDNIQLRRLALYPIELRGREPILAKLAAQPAIDYLLE